jgi:hypothetical protein
VYGDTFRLAYVKNNFMRVEDKFVTIGMVTNITNGLSKNEIKAC